MTGEEFNILIKRLGWTKAETAKRLNVSWNTIYNYTKMGKIPGPVESFMRIYEKQLIE